MTYGRDLCKRANGTRWRFNPSLKTTLVNSALVLFFIFLTALSFYELGKKGGAIDHALGITIQEANHGK